MKFSGASRFLPSRRVGALLLIVVALIISVMIVRADTTQSPKKITATLTSEPIQINENDTDGDGIKDWEESLWGLSATSTDSDGDGIGDAQEIKQSKDLFSQLPSDIFAQATEDSGSVTPVGAAGRLLVSQFLTAKETGLSYTQKDVQNAASLALSAQNAPRTYTTHSLSELTLTQATDSAALHAYGNAITDALTNKTSEPAKHELAVLLTFGQSNDQQAFATEMQKVIDRYDTTIKGFLAVTVPQNAASIHLQTLNAMERVKADLTDMASVGADPIISVQAFSVYANDSAAMTGSFETLRAFFSQNSVIFDQSEPAYTFIHVPAQTTK